MTAPQETLALTYAPGLITARISRPARANSINAQLIRELGAALDQAERTPGCNMLVIQGQPGVFCTGMDFKEASEEPAVNPGAAVGISEYMELLNRFTLSPKVIVTVIDGKVIAGGVGFVAASDFAIATPRSEFSLSEALWGLLPCCVIPFLLRRVGFQKAYSMTLTTRTIGAEEARNVQLIDELSPSPEEALRKLSLRVNLLEAETVRDLKRYFRKMWIMTPEMQNTAVDEITRLAALPRVRQNLENFVQFGRFPWEKNVP
jgi:polyketide biosynthesis enoyl-CoA hydratase PksH